MTTHPQQKEKIKKIFGVPFDPANSPERLNLKLAYLSHVMKGAHPSETFDDPYDAIKAYAIKETPFLCEDIWLGKMPVESWLRPRPRPEDMNLLTPSRAGSFLENNGCWDYALKVTAFVEESVFPHVPVMIGVDHSLTGGVLMALAKKYSPLNEIITFSELARMLETSPSLLNYYLLTKGMVLADQKKPKLVEVDV